jgi:hypothetical protein
MRIEPRFLDEISKSPSDHELGELHRRLGQLTAWWLHDDCVARLRASNGPGAVPAPTLLEGQFAVLFRRTLKRPWLQRAFALPLRWSNRVDSDDPRLPQELRDLADKVRRLTVGAGAAHEPKEFFLELGDGCPDLSRLNMPAASAGAAMFAALHCAIHRVQPDRTKTASAELGIVGLEPVDGIEEKAHAAARLGIRELVVAPEQPEVRLEGCLDLEIRRLSGRTMDEHRAKLIEVFDAPPYGAPFEQQLDWYNRMPGRSSDTRTAFYTKCLVRNIAERARAAVELPDIDTLLLCAGRVVEPVLLAAEALRARRVLLLYMDAGDQSAAKRSEASFSELTMKPKVELVGIRRDIDALSLHSQLLGLLSPHESVGVDLTPGPKDIAIYLERFARSWTGHQPCACTYITSHTENGRAVYGKHDRIVMLHR